MVLEKETIRNGRAFNSGTAFICSIYPSRSLTYFFLNLITFLFQTAYSETTRLSSNNRKGKAATLRPRIQRSLDRSPMSGRRTEKRRQERQLNIPWKKGDPIKNNKSISFHTVFVTTSLSTTFGNSKSLMRILFRVEKCKPIDSIYRILSAKADRKAADGRRFYRRSRETFEA